LRGLSREIALSKPAPVLAAGLWDKLYLRKNLDLFKKRDQGRVGLETVDQKEKSTNQIHEN